MVEKIYGTSEASWAQVRTDYMSGLGHLFPALKDVSYGTATLDSVPTMRAVPEGSEPQRVLLYIHGGGYVHGGVEGYRGLTGTIGQGLECEDLCTRLSSGTGISVSNPD